MLKMMRFQCFSFIPALIFFSFWGHLAFAEEQEGRTLSLVEAIQILKKENPQITRMKQNAKKEAALVKSQYALPDPMVSYQELDRGNNTKYWGVSQKVEFPSLYLARGSAQKHRARGADVKHSAITLKQRGELIYTYYELYSLEQMIQFTEANQNAIREVARVAERKYTSGDTSQSDSMRAHVEQTSLEAEIRLLQQKKTNALGRLKELLNIPQNVSLELSDLKLKSPPLPEFQQSPEDSFDLQIAREAYLEADNKKFEASLEFMPDFQVRYQRQFSGSPVDSHILMLEASVPLWFWGATGKAQAAQYEQNQKQAELLATKNRIDREHYTLVENLKTQNELLEIYENALIPQAQTSYSATSSSYKASKASFLDLLERERFLLGVQIKFYGVLIDYVRLLTQYEQVVGREIIDASSLQENL